MDFSEKPEHGLAVEGDCWSKEIEQLDNVLASTHGNVPPVSKSPLAYEDRGPDELLQVPDHAEMPQRTKEDLEKMKKMMPAELVSRPKLYWRIVSLWIFLLFFALIVV